MLLLAAAEETGLIGTLLAGLPEAAGSNRLARSQDASREGLLLTLLFLGAVGLSRPWELRGYSGDGLALLSGRRWAYGYVHSARFLAQVAQAGGDQTLTVAVAQWATQLWDNDPQAIYYVDMHRKPVYSDYHLPRGKIGRTGKILGCRALALLNDPQGHPLIASTGRGDTHLTHALPPLLAGYHQALGYQAVKRIVVDREGLGAEFLDQLQESYQMITLLKANQYHDLSDFDALGSFEPLSYDRQGQLVTEVAAAEFMLPLPNDPEQGVALSVALVRDWRRDVPLGTDEVAAELTLPAVGEPAWWEPDWQPTPLPAPPTQPKLIPVVSTAPVEAVAALVGSYKQRWAAQENIIRDFLLPLGLDTNHGYAKTPVENSEIAKRQAEVTRQIDRLSRWRISALERSRRAADLYQRRRDKAQAHATSGARQLLDLQCQLIAQPDLPTPQLKQRLQQQKDRLQTEVDRLRQAAYRADRNRRDQWDKAANHTLNRVSVQRPRWDI